MKQLHATIACLILLTSGIRAQEDVFSNKVNTALDKVLKDYPNRFHNIKGEIIGQDPQTTEYRSTVQVPGSTSCTVTRCTATQHEINSWTYSAFHSEDFYLAKAKFKEIFTDVENTIVKIEGEKPFILTGQYETPSENRKITSVDFELLPAVGDIRKIRVQLLIQHGKDWKVSLNVSDNNQKDEEKGALTGN
jgi:hypothetical protein